MIYFWNKKRVSENHSLPDFFLEGKTEYKCTRLFLFFKLLESVSDLNFQQVESGENRTIDLWLTSPMFSRLSHSDFPENQSSK